MSTWDDLRCELEHTQQDCAKLYEKNQDLERQLVEAREAEIEFLNRLYVYEENIASEREIINRVLKLKGKADEFN